MGFSWTVAALLLRVVVSMLVSSTACEFRGGDFVIVIVVILRDLEIEK